MGNLFRNLWACSVLTLTMCTVLAAQDTGPSDAISLDSKSVTIDRQTNLIEWGMPEFTQGDTHIRADRALATSDDFEQRGELRFIGHVRITLEAGKLEADSAVFTFDHGQLLHGKLEGSPVSLTGIEASTKNPIRGEATAFEYDKAERTLRMAGNARVIRTNNQGSYEIRGCDLIYNFEAESVRSGSTDCPEPFRFRKLAPTDQQQPATPDSPQ
jgi:lipopolysaccharide transport protein LptA